jgi:transcriptional regulator with XRE-family HTH domain
MRVNGGKTMAWTNVAQAARFHAAMEEHARQNLAKRVKELRRYKGWTEADLWQKSGVSIQTISRIENAKTEEPRENTLKSLAKAFGVTHEDLAGPRSSPEEVELAYQSQLDNIEGMLEEVLRLLRHESLGDVLKNDEGDDGPGDVQGGRAAP